MNPAFQHALAFSLRFSAGACAALSASQPGPACDKLKLKSTSRRAASADKRPTGRVLKCSKTSKISDQDLLTTRAGVTIIGFAGHLDLRVRHSVGRGR